MMGRMPVLTVSAVLLTNLVLAGCQSSSNSRPTPSIAKGPSTMNPVASNNPPAGAPLNTNAPMNINAPMNTNAPMYTGPANLGTATTANGINTPPRTGYPTNGAPNGVSGNGMPANNPGFQPATTG